MVATPDIVYLAAQAGAQRILDSLVLGSEIAVFAWILLRLVPRPSSATRFAVWFSALVAMAALPLSAGPLAARVSAGAPAVVPKSWAITLPASWALYLFAAWGLIAGFGVLRLAFGLWQLRSLRRSCLAINLADLPPLVRNTVQDFGSARQLKVCLSDRLHVPTALGFFRPAVVLPSWLLQQLAPEELNQILLHEIAHLRRHDDWTNLAQKLLHALLFFHPAVWWIEEKLSLAREMACDDAVLRATPSPRSYAQCLARLAEKSFLRRSLALGQAAVSRMRQTSQRVAYILDAQPRAAARAWKTAAPLLAVLLLASFLLTSRSPRLLAFQNLAPALPLRATSPRSALPLVRANYVVGSRPVLPVSLATQSRPSAGPARRYNAPGSAVMSNGAAAPLRSRLAQTSPAPRLLRLKADGPGEPSPWSGEQFVVVTMEGQQWGADGPQVWLVRVWRLTLLDPRVNPVRQAISQKTT